MNKQKLRKLAGLTESSSTVQVHVPFNGFESQLSALENAGLKVVGVRTGGGGNTEVSIEGHEDAIRKYLAHLWDLDEDSEEINELF